MKRKIYAKTYLLIGLFPLIGFVLFTLIYLVVGGVLSRFDILPLNYELYMGYHILTICLPLGLVFGVLYWRASKITLRDNEVIIRTKRHSLKRNRIKMGDIIEICAHENDSNDSINKCRVQCVNQELELVEFWYDEKELENLAREIKTRNPNIRINRNLKKA